MVTATPCCTSASRTSVVSLTSFELKTLRMCSSLGWKVQLPRYAKAIDEPAKLRAEAVVAQGHQDSPALRQGAKGALQLRGGIEVHERRARRREGEVVLDRAVRAHKLAAAKREDSYHDGAGRTGPALHVALDPHHAGIGERR